MICLTAATLQVLQRVAIEELNEGASKIAFSDSYATDALFLVTPQIREVAQCGNHTPPACIPEDANTYSDDWYGKTCLHHGYPPPLPVNVNTGSR